MPRCRPTCTENRSFLDPNPAARPAFVPLEIASKAMAEPRYGQELTNPAERGSCACKHERGGPAREKNPAHGPLG